MAHYISKDALVAEIKRLKLNLNWIQEEFSGAKEIAYDNVLDFLNGHEVKEVEVDLDKEIELVKRDYEQVNVAWNNDFDFIAKHFFELGMAVINKAQKGE